MKTYIFFCMYGELSITRFFWHLAIFHILFWCRLMNIFLKQFWTVKLLIHKPQPRRIIKSRPDYDIKTVHCWPDFFVSCLVLVWWWDFGHNYSHERVKALLWLQFSNFSITDLLFFVGNINKENYIISYTRPPYRGL